MMLTILWILVSLMAVDCAAVRERRGVYPAYAKIWPNGIIPYIISGNYTNDEITMIKYGMSTLMEKTKMHETSCITFVERTNHTDYIDIVSRQGCSSFIGKIGKRQTIDLVTPGCINPRNVVHELIHALGFDHEHVRHDRDAYVEVIYRNIVPGVHDNFHKIRTYDTMNYAYDLKSIMHYGSGYFAIPGTNYTIYVIGSNFTKYAMSAPMEMSEIDIAEIRELYKCIDKKEEETKKFLSNSGLLVMGFIAVTVAGLFLI